MRERKLMSRKKKYRSCMTYKTTLNNTPEKDSLELHGIPQNTFTTTEEAVLKVAEALEVEVRPQDIQISHHLKGEVGVKPIIVKFASHKTKAALYKQRTKLKHITLSDISRFVRCFVGLLQRHFHKRKSDLTQTRAIKGGKQKTYGQCYIKCMDN